MLGTVCFNSQGRAMCIIQLAELSRFSSLFKLPIADSHEMGEVTNLAYFYSVSV